MDFTSPIFLFAFLPAVLGLHFLFRSIPARNTILLIASILFYAWGEPGFVLLLIASAAANAGFGWAMNRRRERARAILIVAVGFNLLILIYFKYAHFLFSSTARWTGFNPGWAKVALPLAISFFTFHAITYLVAIYREEAPPQRNPAWVALYIFFFPQLIAGPIVRYPSIAPALERRRTRLGAFASGVRQFAAGLAKKVLIANVLAVPADRVFSLSASSLSRAAAWLGVLLYALQIFFDFSGYSDMALGLARMFGFEFQRNFNYPYVSRSVREFWRRWHISLSSFFRDYVYIPLGGDRDSAWRTGFNLVLVFVLCGLWHGASWTFLAWGLYHGLFIAGERTAAGRAFERAPSVLRWLYAMLVVLLGWVYFRSETIGGANRMLGAMFLGRAGTSPFPATALIDREVLAAITAGVLLSSPILPRLFRRSPRLFQRIPWARRGAVASVRVAGVAMTFLFLFLSVVWLSGDTYRPFIYFRF